MNIDEKKLDEEIGSLIRRDPDRYWTLIFRSMLTTFVAGVACGVCLHIFIQWLRH